MDIYIYNAIALYWFVYIIFTIYLASYLSSYLFVGYPSDSILSLRKLSNHTQHLVILHQ